MQVDIKTEDGTCPAHVYHPDRPSPGVILYMDGIGMRAALHPLAERVAAAGYYVLMPDLFYRSGPYEAPDPKMLFADEKVRGEWFKQIATHTTIAGVMKDTRAFLDHLDKSDAVKHPTVGVFGYCMGGRMALSAAGHYPDRIAAAAAFHPGGLATDASDSPHRLADRIRARVLIVAASNDASFPDEQKQRLAEALTQSRVDYTLDTYPARHGWVPSDTPAHDPIQSERAFQALFTLLASTLSA
jgi:carboxymethylenebutenolidase